MTWNYRVVRKVYDDGYISFGIYEVFYDDDGNIEYCTEEPVRKAHRIPPPVPPEGGSHIRLTVPVDADSLEELKETYKMMAEAFEQEVIDFESIGQGGV